MANPEIRLRDIFEVDIGVRIGPEGNLEIPPQKTRSIDDVYFVYEAEQDQVVLSKSRSVLSKNRR